MHRLYHMPAIGEEWIEHYADDYEEVIDLTANNATFSTHDSDTLQFFALEVYAYDIAAPGVGCAGTAHRAAAPASSSVSSAVASSTSSAAASAPTSGTATNSQAASLTSSLPANCHTHEGGDVHCI